MSFTENIIKSTQQAQIDAMKGKFEIVQQKLNDALTTIPTSVQNDFRRAQTESYRKVLNEGTESGLRRILSGGQIALGGIGTGAMSIAIADHLTSPNAPYALAAMAVSGVSLIASLAMGSKLSAMEKPKYRVESDKVFAVMLDTHMDIQNNIKKYADGGELTDGQLIKMCEDIVKFQPQLRTGLDAIIINLDKVDNVVNKYTNSSLRV